jgi:hypothetical protein
MRKIRVSEVQIPPCILNCGCEPAEETERGRPQSPRSQEAVREQGSPRSNQAVKARTVAGAVCRARIVQGRAQPRRRTMTMLDAVFVGINVSKGTLDVALRPSGESFRVSNDQGGIRALVERLSGVQPSW